MAYLGELPHFYGDGYDWNVFTERLEQFFEINDVVEEKKKAILITCIGDQVYKTLRDVCHPALPKEKSFDELCELLNKQFVVKTSVFRERCNFYTAKQQKKETVSAWFARIKSLSIDCKFGERFDDILLDRFISGLKPSPVLDRLCEENEETLTLQQAFDIAVTKESATKDRCDEDDEDVGDKPNQGQSKKKNWRNKKRGGNKKQEPEE